MQQVESPGETEHYSQHVFRHRDSMDSLGVADQNRILLRFRKNQGLHAGRQGMDPAKRFRLSVKRPNVVEPPGDQNVGIDHGAGGIPEFRGDDVRGRGDPGDERLLAVGNGIEDKNFRCSDHDLPPVRQIGFGDLTSIFVPLFIILCRLSKSYRGFYQGDGL